MDLVTKAETEGAKAQRVFTEFDAEGSGFVSVDRLSDLMKQLDLETEPE